MASRLTILGSGTCQLQLERMASSVLVELGGLRLLFDCGRGVCHRLVEHGVRQDDLHAIVLSHYHPDHISDLIPYLHAAAYSQIDPRTTNLTLIGPAGLTERVRAIRDLVAPGELFETERYRVVLQELESDSFEVSGQRFESAELPPAGNRGLAFTRNDRRIVLTGDSHFHDAEVEFVRRASLAVVDAGHLSEEQLVELAVRSQVERLVMSHLYIDLEPSRLQKRARGRGFRGVIERASDGDLHRL